MTLSLRNRQRTRSIDLRLLRKVTVFLLKEILNEPQFELGIHFVGADEITRLNETFLQHHGSTDVITFDYKEAKNENGLHGEIFISVDDAVMQAKEFRTTWQMEVARYIVHGILHLQGQDDLDSASRKKMKRVEERTLKELAKQFSLKQLQRKL